MIRCEHDHLFSGRTNAHGKFEFICRSCGKLGWSDSYQLSQVDAWEFYHQRAQHGWPTRLPAPPRTPSLPVRETCWRGPLMFNAAVFLASLAFGLWSAGGAEHYLVAAIAGTAALFGVAVSFRGWRGAR